MESVSSQLKETIVELKTIYEKNLTLQQQHDCKMQMDLVDATNTIEKLRKRIKFEQKVKKSILRLLQKSNVKLKRAKRAIYALADYAGLENADVRMIQNDDAANDDASADDDSHDEIVAAVWDDVLETSQGDDDDLAIGKNYLNAFKNVLNKIIFSLAADLNAGLQQSTTTSTIIDEDDLDEILCSNKGGSLTSIPEETFEEIQEISQEVNLKRFEGKKPTVLTGFDVS